MLHKPLRGLDGFSARPRYKTAANAGVKCTENL
jgi:hypothetical protein